MHADIVRVSMQRTKVAPYPCILYMHISRISKWACNGNIMKYHGCFIYFVLSKHCSDKNQHVIQNGCGVLGVLIWGPIKPMPDMCTGTTPFVHLCVWWNAISSANDAGLHRCQSSPQVFDTWDILGSHRYHLVMTSPWFFDGPNRNRWFTY